MITLYTIGFTKKSAEQFFELLKDNNVKQLVDIRISNNSQLAGFAKGKDLSYFVNQICGINYNHNVDFAPTKNLLDRWHKQDRDIIKKYGVKQFDKACFLCSEESPEICHRRLLVEYMQRHSLEDVKIIHLV